MTNYRIIFTLLCCLSFIGCGDGDDEPSGGPKPALSMTIASSGANSVTLNMKRTNATSVKIIYKATGVITSETAQSVAQNGTQYTGTTVEIDGLAAQTTYTVFAVACNDSGEYSQMQYVRFTTDAPGPQMYPWEQSRNGILSYTDMVLCYGGSHHRTHGRQVHRRSTVTASADNVSGLPLNVELDGVAYHGFGRSANLARGQTELLLGCQNRANGRRIGIAVHEVIDEPLGFLGAQVVPSDQLGEDRLPCDFGHDTLLDASARHIVV